VFGTFVYASLRIEITFSGNREGGAGDDTTGAGNAVLVVVTICMGLLDASFPERSFAEIEKVNSVEDGKRVYSYDF